jgi:hypothetical protein
LGDATLVEPCQWRSFRFSLIQKRLGRLRLLSRLPSFPPELLLNGEMSVRELSLAFAENKTILAATFPQPCEVDVVELW